MRYPSRVAGVSERATLFFELIELMLFRPVGSRAADSMRRGSRSKGVTGAIDDFMFKAFRVSSNVSKEFKSSSVSSLG